MFAIIKETSTILKRVICSSYRYHTSVWCLSRGYCRSIRRVVTPLTARNFNPVIAMAAGTVIATLKRFKIIAERYRSCRRFGLRFFLIAAI